MPVATDSKIQPIFCEVSQIISFGDPLLQTSQYTSRAIRPSPDSMPSNSTPLLHALVEELFDALGQKVQLKILTYDRFHLKLHYLPSEDVHVFEKIEEAVAKADAET